MKNAAHDSGQPSAGGLPQLSIIIVSYNTYAITRDCLQSVRDARLALTYETIVVDNDSTDGSAEMIARDFTEVTLIRNPENMMFAKANNQALRIATGEYVLLLNSDTTVAAGNIEKLHAFLRQNQPKVACVGPRVLNRDGSVQSEGEAFDSCRYVLCQVLFLNGLPIPFPIQSRLLPPGFPHAFAGKTRKVGWITGCCMMLSKVAVEKVGGLDEDFVFFCEDTELCYRLARHGYATYVVPGATVTHLGGASQLAAKRLTEDLRPRIPDDLACRFLFYAKTSGIGHKIAVNRLRTALLPLALPLLRLCRPALADLLRAKLALHRAETAYFIEHAAEARRPEH